MKVEQLPLARQVEIVFSEIKEELQVLNSGTLFLQIRNNVIGKFGIKHIPIEGKGGELQSQSTGLTEPHFQSFIQMALQSLQYKKWTHGEILFDFRIKQNTLHASVQFESNYNMANLSIT
jgi:hypothetical protein